MIQRKQTLFLLLAFVAAVVCLSLPVGYFEPEAMGTSLVMTNLWITGETGTRLVLPLFISLLLTCPLMLWAILAYRKRRLQARLCMWCMVLNVVWYALHIVYGYGIGVEGMAFRPAFAFCLPLVSSALLLMARKGILDDERLVRSADRIR